MRPTDLVDCLQPELAFLERPQYFARQLLSEVDLRTEQNYHLARARRHNRFLHGWGVVCGLEVKPAPIAEAPWRVRIDVGYALGPRGYEIWVADRVYMDLAECGPGAISDPCDPAHMRGSRSSESEILYLAIQHAECFARPVRVSANGCGCDEEDCQYSRIRDSFQLECLPELPPSHQPDPDFLCDIVSGESIMPCLPCPDDPWVVLAEVRLPGSPRDFIATENINNLVRRRLFSTAVLQEQLIACCCEQREQLLKVTGVDFVIVDDQDNIGNVFDSLLSPTVTPDFGTRDSIGAIRVRFNRALNSASVSTPADFDDNPDLFSFVITAEETAIDELNGNHVPGTVSVNGDEFIYAVNFNTADQAGSIVNKRRFPMGIYTVVIRANDGGPAVSAADTSQLDGEWTGFPSGDDNAGGDFEFKFIIERTIL